MIAVDTFAFDRHFALGRRTFGMRKGDEHFPFFAEYCGMAEGTIKKLVSDKGFGFIEGERGELFFHHSAVKGTPFEQLHEGQRVSYSEGRGPKGPRAESVTPV